MGPSIEEAARAYRTVVDEYEKINAQADAYMNQAREARSARDEAWKRVQKAQSTLLLLASGRHNTDDIPF